MHPGFVPLESSRRSGPKTFHKNVFSSLESAIPNLNTKVYEPQLSRFTRARPESLTCLSVAT